MKKWIVCFMVLAMVGMTVPLFGAEAFFPGRAFTGYIGAKQSGSVWPWGSVYSQYMYLYGTQTTYKYTFTGTPTANRTVNFGNPATGSYVAYTGSSTGGTATYIPFYDASGNLASDASFNYNSTTDRLTVYDASFSNKITVTGDASTNTSHASTYTASGAISGASVTATGDVSGNSVHSSTGTFSNLGSGRVAKTTTGGQLTPSTVTDASFEAAIAPILVDASGTGGTTLTQTMFQSYRCQFDNFGQGAADASAVLPLAARNLACQGVVVTAQSNKWGVQDTTCTMTLLDGSGAVQAGPYCYVLYDNAVAGQSFDVWTQKYDATTYRWFIKPRVIGTGRTFTGSP